MTSEAPLSISIKELRSSISSNNPTLVLPLLIDLLSSAHARVYEALDVTYVGVDGVGRDEVGREERIVDHLIKLPMVLR